MPIASELGRDPLDLAGEVAQGRQDPQELLLELLLHLVVLALGESRRKSAAVDLDVDQVAAAQYGAWRRLGE